MCHFFSFFLLMYRCTLEKKYWVGQPTRPTLMSQSYANTEVILSIVTVYLGLEYQGSFTVANNFSSGNVIVVNHR